MRAPGVAYAAAVAVGVILPLNAHAQTPACQAGAERAFTVAPLLVQPTVNGTEHEVAAVRFLAPGGPLFIAEPQLKDWGILSDSLKLLSHTGVGWLCLEGNGLAYRLDSAKLTLALDLPPELFAGSRASLLMEDRLPVTYSRGGFVNYDLRYDRSAGSPSLGLNWEVGAFARAGLISSSFFSGDKDRGTIRLDTAFRRDDPDHITSTIVGDTVTRAGSYGASIRMGGFQFQRNFGNAPLLITYPTAEVSGIASVPSTVDVYIGNAKTYSTQVKPGPFSVSNLPVPVGAGNVRVVTRDLFGKETAVVVPYVRYDSMLKAGLQDYSYEAGWLRRNYSVNSNDYGDWAAVASHRVGVTNWLTIEGHAEAMADRGNLGGVIQATMPVLGLAGVGGAVSIGEGRGKLAKVYFQRTERNWSIGAAAEQRSENYMDIAFEPGQVRKLSTRQASASARLTDWIWLNLLGLRTTDQSGAFNSGTFGVTVSLTRSATLTAGASRFWGTQPTETVYSITLSLPLSARDYTTTTVEQRSDAAKPEVLVTANRNLLETNSFGYRLLAAEQSAGRRLELGASWQTGVGQFGIEAADTYDTRSTRAFARGGIAAAGGEWRISRYLDQSFAIVKVGDFPGVRVYSNSQAVGMTDANGVAVIPRLSGFLPSKIAFEPEDIPLDGSFGENAKRVKIANRMGVLFDMGVLRRISATLTLNEAGVGPVAAGASVRVGDEAEEFPVARQGRVYVSGLKRGVANILRVKIGERSCSATVELPADFASGTTMGLFICQ